MRNKRINLLKQYRNILIDLKKIELHNKLSQETENKLYTLGGDKPKVLVLKRNQCKFQ